MKVYSTGIKELDKILGGGIPHSCSVLLLGETGTEPETLAFEILYFHLKQGGQGVLYVFDHPPSEVRHKMRSFGRDIKKFEKNEEKLILADFFTHAFSLEEFYEPEKYFCKRPTDYTYITDYFDNIWQILLQKLGDNRGYLGVVFSLTTVAHWCGEREALRLAYLIATKYRPLGCTIFVLDPSTVSESTLGMLKNRSEVVINLSIEEFKGVSEKRIMVLKSPLPGWLNKPLTYTSLPEKGFFIRESIIQEFEAFKETIKFDEDTGELKVYGAPSVLITRRLVLELLENMNKKKVEEILVEAMIRYLRILEVNTHLKGEKLLEYYLKSLPVRGWGFIELVEFRKNKFTLRKNPTDFAGEYKEGLEGFKALVKGIVKGAGFYFFGNKVRVKEKKCILKGDPFCEYEVVKLSPKRTVNET